MNILLHFMPRMCILQLCYVGIKHHSFVYHCSHDVHLTLVFGHNYVYSFWYEMKSVFEWKNGKLLLITYWISLSLLSITLMNQ